MLGLKLPTDPRWVNIVEKNISEILCDHAFCEQKAASTAISLIVSFPEYNDLIKEMIVLVAKHLICYSRVSKSIMNMTRILVLELYCQPMGTTLTKNFIRI